MRWFYRCAACGAEYKLEPGRYLCDACSAGQKRERPLEGVLDCVWDGNFIGGADDIPLPVEGKYFPSLPVGRTPLWQPARLREETGFTNLYIKDDTCEPSGSFKDRASFLVAAFAKQHGLGEIALASTGNAASSMACIGASCNIKITVFLPKAAPVAKRVQVLQYGAELREVDANYDVAFERSLDYSRETGVMSRNTAYNPLTIEGKKTVSFEMARDLAVIHANGNGSSDRQFRAPDHVFVAAGDGTILSGVYKGFEDLVRLGRIPKVPTVWACQASGSSAIARALEIGCFADPVPSVTVADSISVDVPRNGAHALAKLRKHGGRAIVVSDGEILSAQRELSSKSGLFAEPSAAAAWAGFAKAAKELGRHDTIVVMITGSGLKDIAGAMKALEL